MGLNAFFKGMLEYTVVRFALVGILNTAFGYCVYAILILLGLHYAMATLSAMVVGVLFNFRTIGGLVFRNRQNGLFFRFIGVYVVTYGIHVSLLNLASRIQPNMLISGAAVAVPVSIVTFLLHRTFVFSMQPTPLR